MLISLRPIGGDGSVNPEYVTSIVTSNNRTMLWVRGNSGYGTYGTYVSVSMKRAQEYLNDPKRYMRNEFMQRFEEVLEELADVTGMDERNERVEAVYRVINELTGIKAQLEQLEK